jgi:hypothetical protein
MKLALKTRLAPLGVAAFLVASLLQAQAAHAKISVPYGPNGEPPDSTLQQEADEYNDLLDGPKDGQSYEAWAAELDALHDLMFDSDAPTDLSTASSTNDSSGPSDVAGDDLCQTELSAWLQPGSSVTTAQAIHDPKTLKAVENNLEAFFFHMLKIETAGSAAVVSRPQITELTCDPTSALSIEVPVAWDAPIVGTIKAGTVSLHASVMRRGVAWPEWCVVVSDYRIVNVDPFILPLVKARIKIVMEDNPFCGGAFAPTR